MKKSIFLSLVVCIVFTHLANAQGGLLKKVTKSMTNELLGRPQEVDRGPEPKCACADAKLIMDLGGKVQLDYKELSISVADDGSILAKSRVGDEYYIIRDGVTTGPLKAGDKRLKGFEDFVEPDRNNAPDNSTGGESKGDDPWLKYEYITKSGEKYLITFKGKSYGPYGAINGFAVSHTKEKFAAIVIENTPYSKMDAKKMEAEMKNAKTDQEKMDLSMKYAQQMQENMMAGGGPAAMQPKFISNIPDVVYDPIKTISGTLSGNLKYDDIFMVAYDKITDLKGNTLIPIVPEAFGSEKLYLNTDNTKYAYYNYGTLTFNDKTNLSELFGTHLLKVDGQVYLAYMYYSPKKNSIMQCKIAF
jgi:hypothetical protein